MTCDEVRALLLEAEPDALRGEGDAALALHLRHCPRCAAAAGAILAGTAALDAYLDGSALAPADPARVEAVLRALGVPSGPAGPAVAPEAPRRRPVSRRLPVSRRAAWAPLALAAAAAGLLFVTRRPEPVPEDARPLSVPGSLPAPAAVPVVEGASAATVAVINTDNPDITVLWFF